MKNTLFCIALLSSIILLFTQNTSYTYSSGNFAARTNAPGESSCAASSCHGTGALNGSGSVEFSISGTPDSYELGQTYTISVQTNDSNASRFGMQMTCLQGNPVEGNSPSVGSFVAPTNMQIRTQGNRSYIVHKNTQNDTGDWEFEWIAPETNEGVVTFYIAALAANGNGNKSGDFAYFETMTLNGPQEVLCPEFSTPEIPATPMCPGDEFSLAVELGGEIPNGVTNYYYYYSLDPEFDPYAGEGEYLGSAADELFSIVNDLCIPKNYSVKVAFVKFDGSDVVDGPPTDENCRPVFPLGQIVVFPSVSAVPTFDASTCELKIKTNCVQHLVGVNADGLVQDTYTTTVNPGESIEVIDYIVRSGDVTCDFEMSFSTEINATCDESCGAEAGEITFDKTIFCSDENVEFEFSGNNTNDGFEQRFVATSGSEYTIEALSETASFDGLDAGEYCIHTLNFSTENAPEIPSVGEGAGMILGQTEACFDLDPLACVSITVLECDTIVDGIEKPIFEGFKAFFNENSDIIVNFNSLESRNAELYLFDVSGKLLKEQKVEIVIGENNNTLTCSELVSGIYILNIGGEYSVKLFKGQ